MKKSLYILAVVLIAAVLAGFAPAQKRRGRAKTQPVTIREEAATTTTSAPAPAECAMLVRALIAYVSRETPDIAADSAAQNRWLSESLRKAVQHRLASYKEYQKKNGDSPEQLPSNADFVGSWD
jgi:cell division protein FtsN